MTRKELATQALRESIAVRRRAKLTVDQPLNPIDLALDMKVAVRFVDISMEGMYQGGNRPTILLSSLRPFGRRNFTCGHELAHYTFGHGSTIDELKQASASSQFQPEEFLADVFSGYLLMPPPGIAQSAKAREINLDQITDTEALRLCTVFGVGFETLVTHLSATGQLGKSHASCLRQSGLAGVRRKLIGLSSDEGIAFVDTHFEAKTLDLEVGMMAILPHDSECKHPGLKAVRELPEGHLYEVSAPGVGRAVSESRGWSAFIRVAPHRYVGLAAYRHLEAEDESV